LDIAEGKIRTGERALIGGKKERRGRINPAHKGEKSFSRHSPIRKARKKKVGASCGGGGKRGE